MAVSLLAYLERKLDGWQDLDHIDTCSMSPNQPNFHYGLDIYRLEGLTTLV